MDGPGQVLPAAASSNDRILISPDSEIHGEIESLADGQLRVQTDFMGTVAIDWQRTLVEKSV